VINDILDLSKIESQKLTIELMSVELKEILLEIDRLMTMNARDKNLDFTIECVYPLPRAINTDPTRLKQILINLCSNAIKFTDDGSVKIRVSCEPSTQRVKFSVIDTGIGIESDSIEVLFDTFTQADVSTTRRFGGTGLGLNISRRLARMLGGDIDVRSALGQGSTFTAAITIAKQCFEDMASTDEDMRQSINAKQANYGGIERCLRGKVLLAEDNLDNQSLIVHFLERLGIDVTVVENGAQAVESVLQEQFDLVLMDMQMPEMDGPTATELLRQTGCNIPIVALTANAGSEERQRCTDAGCTDFLSKPIDRQHFYSVLSEHLRQEDEAIDDAATELPEELILKFVELLRERRVEIKATFDSDKRDTLKSLMHQFKGSAPGYGFIELGGIAAKIETALKTDLQADIDRDMVAFLQECERILGNYVN
jgi:CheY-like chemotaxis protein